MVEVTKRISTWSLKGGARDWTARSVDVSTAGLPGVSDTSGEQILSLTVVAHTLNRIDIPCSKDRFPSHRVGLR